MGRGLFVPDAIRRPIKEIYRISPLWKQDLDDRANKLAKYYKGLDIVKEGNTVFDVGAFDGSFSAAFSLLGCKIVAIEPDYHNLTLLAKTAMYYPNIEIVNAAVSSRNELAELHCLNHGGNSSLSIRYGEGKALNSITVCTVTLDVIIERYGKPAYINMDIEGHEPEALEGLSYQIPAISVEMTFRYGKETPSRAMAQLQRLGFSRFLLNDAEYGAEEAIRTMERNKDRIFDVLARS